MTCEVVAAVYPWGIMSFDRVPIFIDCRHEGDRNNNCIVFFLFFESTKVVLNNIIDLLPFSTKKTRGNQYKKNSTKIKLFLKLSGQIHRRPLTRQNG